MSLQCYLCDCVISAVKLVAHLVKELARVLQGVIHAKLHWLHKPKFLGLFEGTAEPYLIREWLEGRLDVDHYKVTAEGV